MPHSFAPGDRVVVIATDVTKHKRLAGLVGVVEGEREGGYWVAFKTVAAWVAAKHLELADNPI